MGRYTTWYYDTVETLRSYAPAKFPKKVILTIIYNIEFNIIYLRFYFYSIL